MVTKKKAPPNKKATTAKKKAVAIPKNTNKKVPARQSNRVVRNAKQAAHTKNRAIKKKKPQVSAKRKLTTKQAVFIDEYLVDHNATKAAIRAGYSKNTAQTIGAENLTKPIIKQAVAEALEERSKRTKIDADWLLKRLAEEAEADVSDLYYEGGGLKPVHEWPLIWRQGLVGGMDVEQQFTYVEGEKEPDGIITKIKLSDRTKRLEMIGKHIDVLAFVKQVISTENTDLAERMRRGRDRAQGKRGG